MDQRTHMTFERYPQDTQSPECRKACIDHRRLKVQLSVTCASAMQQVETLDSSGSVVVACTHNSGPSDQKMDVEMEEACPDQGDTMSARITSPWDSGSDLATITAADTIDLGPFPPVRQRTNDEEGRNAVESEVESSKTHHASTFNTGLWLGLALPAIGWGAYLSIQEQTRESLPSWDVLLFVYSLLVVPVLLALLVGINILVWVRKKINYVSIFGLDPTTRLDPREYFQLPSFLLCTLAYAFWFSMAQMGPPLLWPLIWVALTAVVMVNPFRRFMWGRARWWTIKHIAKLTTSGIWKVKFIDVWLGDQMCSLDYSIANLYFVGCSYSHFFVDFGSSNSVDSGSPSTVHATTPYQAELSPSISAFQSLRSAAYDQRVQDVWSTCSVSQNLAWYYCLGMLPFMARFVQCLRQYQDSKVPIQLINAGKYMTGIISYFVYSYWKHQGSPHTGGIYFLWCFTATVNSIYSCSWDFLMDWSMCESDARYALLREELIYKSQIPCYYFALASNLCIRFIWVNYAILDESQVTVFVFIAALLEMLRRVQWNFYRLENEHLRSVRQLHLTHKVPSSRHGCPYEHSDEEEDEKVQGTVSWLKRQMARVKSNVGSERSAV